MHCVKLSADLVQCDCFVFGVLIFFFFYLKTLYIGLSSDWCHSADRLFD